MADGGESGGPPVGPGLPEDVMRQFTAAISGMSPGELRGVLRELRAVAAPDQDPSVRAAPPSRRGPRRPDVVTYRVRIDLKGTRPPLWRRLELSSDLLLDELHRVVQEAFGWTDSHLHQFSAGPSPSSPEAEPYLCPFQVDEGDIGIPEEQVRLDEVLADPGDKLYYDYDFGDGWQHVIKLETVGARTAPAPAFPATTSPGAAHGEAALAGGLPGPLGELVSAVRDSASRRELLRLLGAARLDEPVLIDGRIAARMVRSYSWLLDRVGTEGIKLTGAGYLPPVHVEAAMAALDLGEEWIGMGNREVQTMPVLHLRESATKMGLLRKHRGMLQATARGKKLRGDPAGLWWHLAERMPPRSPDRCETQAGLLLLAMIAAGASGDLNEVVAGLLGAIGWISSGGTQLTASAAAHAAWDTRTVLRRLGGFRSDRHDSGPGKPTSEGTAFARAALRTWPG